MKVKTLWTLPSQHLPDTELKAPVFITIWLFSCLVFAYLFHRLFHGVNRTWPEFRLILNGVGLLAFWYLFATIDRWIHYDRRPVQFGYIILAPLWEFSRVGSTTLLLWGTYTIVWNELEDRFKKEHQGYWWFAAKCAIFLVCLMSLFYLVLFLALAIVWMEFRSLNTIADIATKRTSFEIAMTAFFVGFGLLTLIAATATIFFKARQVDGRVRTSRVVFWLATLMLLVRSIVEFAITLRVYGPNDTRRSVALSRDVSFGLITCIYLGFMYATAQTVASPHDAGSRGHRRVEANIRGWILRKLETDTSNTRQQSPPFSQVLDDLRDRLDLLLDDGTLSAGSPLTNDANRTIAQQYIKLLEVEVGFRDPKGGVNFYSRSSPHFSSIFNRRPVGSTRRPGPHSGNSSEPILGDSYRSASSPPVINNGRASAPPGTIPGHRNFTAPAGTARMPRQGSFTSRLSSNNPLYASYAMETPEEYPESQYEISSQAESSYTRYSPRHGVPLR